MPRAWPARAWPARAWPARAWSGSGRKAVTWNPPPATGPASRLPPNATARSFMPTRPCRAPPGGPAGPPVPRSLSTVISTPSRPACTRTVARAPGACYHVVQLPGDPDPLLADREPAVIGLTLGFLLPAGGQIPAALPHAVADEPQRPRGQQAVRRVHRAVRRGRRGDEPADEHGLGADQRARTRPAAARTGSRAAGAGRTPPTGRPGPRPRRRAPATAPGSAGRRAAGAARGTCVRGQVPAYPDSNPDPVFSRPPMVAAPVHPKM